MRGKDPRGNKLNKRTSDKYKKPPIDKKSREILEAEEELRRIREEERLKRDLGDLKDKDIDRYRKKSKYEKKLEREAKKIRKRELRALKKADRRRVQDKNPVFRVLNKIRDGLKLFGVGLYKVLSFLMVLVVAFGIGGFIFGSIAVYPVLKEAKAVSYDKLNNIGPNTFNYLESTKVLDKDGNVIGEMRDKDFKYVNFEDTSKYITEGYIAVEDRKFKTHNGIDLKAITRAGVAFIKNKGKITQGGSTITQQVVKNNFLSQEKTFRRKIIEFKLAPEIEKKFSKNDIMEFYINSNFYGNNCYGVESASLYYFGKPSKDLTPGEAAVIIGISNNPSRYNPKTNPDNAIEKRNRVLDQMYDFGVITEDQLKAEKGKDLGVVLQRKELPNESYPVSFAIYNTVLEIMKNEGFEFKYTFDTAEEYNAYKEKYQELYAHTSETVRSGGYTIHTSIDMDKQKALQDIMDNELSRFTEKQDNGKYAMQGSAVLLNNKTGYVDAIIGGRESQDSFNRGFLGVRQPGSVIKPFVTYGPAYDTGLYYPSLKVNDEPIENGPRNSGGKFRGPTTLEEALARSINTIPYRITLDLGMDKSLSYLEKMEFSNLSYLDSTNRSLSLGGFTYGVKPLDMARAMGTVVNSGEYRPYGCVTQVDFQNVGTIYDGESVKPTKVFEVDSSYMLLDSMRGVMKSDYGTGKRLDIKDWDVVGKTGTTNQQKDTWFVGATTDYSLAVWVGYDQPRNTGYYGSTLAGPIWRKMILKAHDDKPGRFERPATVVDKFIDDNGRYTEKDTGKKGMFSQILFDKAEALREEIRIAKQKEKEKELVSKLNVRLKGLASYELVDKSGVYFIDDEVEAIESMLSQIELDTESKFDLEKMLEEVQEDFGPDLIKYREEIAVEKAKIAEQRRRDKMKQLDNLLKDLRDYEVTSISSINIVRSKITNIKNVLSEVDDPEIKSKYTSTLNGLIEIKESELVPYIDKDKELRLREEEARREALILQEEQRIENQKREQLRLEQERLDAAKKLDREKKEYEEKKRKEEESRDREERDDVFDLAS